MIPPLRFLIPGAGGPGTLNLCRSLRRAPELLSLIGTDCDRAFATLALTDEVHLVPRASDSAAYLARIKELVRDLRIDLILPNNSLEIRVLAEHREELGAPLFVPRTRTLDLANSKWESYQVWRAAGVPVPATYLIDTPEDLAAAFDAIEGRPVWVRGAGIPGKGIGVASLPCRTLPQALEWVRYWEGFGGMIASEFLPGDNLTWIGLFRHGRLLTSQCRQRDRYVIPHVSPSGITGAPAVSHTVHDDAAHETGLRAALALDDALDGVVFVDMKGDAQGVPRVTELNAGRFGTTHFFYTCAGLNLPWLLALLALGRPLPELKVRHALPADLYWIRTLDTPPVLIRGQDLRSGHPERGQRMGMHGDVEDHPPALGSA